MVRIVADTTCGLSRDIFTALGIPLIPQIVCFGEDSYCDDTELDTDTFLRKLKASKELPKTAAPPPQLYFPIFERAIKDEVDVMVVAPSAKVSGTVRSAEVAAQDFPKLKMKVVDTMTIAGNLGSLVLMAHSLARQGMELAEIEKHINELIPRGRIYFLVNTLEYLQKGGRLGGAKALVGELLQVKPILCVRNGQVEPFEQQRTKKRALARLVEIIEEQCPKSREAHLCVMQADAHDEAETLAIDLKRRMDLTQIPIYELPPAIVVHAGPGAMAVGFFEA
jgi:DegV family protein with EDD domain